MTRFRAISAQAARSVTIRGLFGCAILLPLFIVLKLTGGAGWSWWWVLAPLWMPFAILLAILVILFIAASIIAAAAVFAELVGIGERRN
jgi:hypothetical protein